MPTTGAIRRQILAKHGYRVGKHTGRLSPVDTVRPKSTAMRLIEQNTGRDITEILSSAGPTQLSRQLNVPIRTICYWRKKLGIKHSKGVK